MKALLRGIVSMAFSTIDDEKAQHTARLTTKNNRAVSRFAISPPPPIPADEADLLPGQPEEWLALNQTDRCIECIHKLALNAPNHGV